MLMQPFVFVSPAHRSMQQRSHRIIRRHFERAAVLFQSLVILMRAPKNIAKPSINGERKRIQLLCVLHLCQGLIRAPLGRKVKRIDVMSMSVVWIQLDGALKFDFSTLEVPIVTSFNDGQRRMRFDQQLIQLERLDGRRFCSGHDIASVLLLCIIPRTHACISIGQPGGEWADKYLADKFAKIGLKPGGDPSTYLQQMRVKIETPQPETSFKVGDTVFKFKTDFAIAQPVAPSEMKDVSGGLVFVGYGVVSDELRRDDLAGIDVKGKIVMVLKGKPKNLNDDVWERAAAERVVFGRLIKKGASGFVVTYQGEAAHFPVVAAYLSNRSVTFAEPLSYPVAPARWSIELLADEYKVPPSVLVGDRAAEKILGTPGKSFAQVKQMAEAGEFVSRDLK